MRTLIGHGENVEAAFEATVRPQDRGNGLKKTVDRPSRLRAEQVAERFEDSTEGGWYACESSYPERREYKAERGIAKKRARVFVFFRA